MGIDKSHPSLALDVGVVACATDGNGIRTVQAQAHSSGKHQQLVTRLDCGLARAASAGQGARVLWLVWGDQSTRVAGGSGKPLSWSHCSGSGDAIGCVHGPIFLFQASAELLVLPAQPAPTFDVDAHPKPASSDWRDTARRFTTTPGLLASLEQLTLSARRSSASTFSLHST